LLKNTGLDRDTMKHGYPRPQLQRSQWESLNGVWRFTFDDALQWRTPDDVDSWPLSIEVPYPPESVASGIGDTGFHPGCWYQRDFDCAVDAGRVLLRFGAVDFMARVWVNGKLAVVHEGGHTPFMADITEHLSPSGRQVLTVAVKDDPHDLTQPRGKQDWQLEAHGIWYPRTSGIWQTVWLEHVGPTYVEELRWTSFADGFAIDVEAKIAGDISGDLMMEVELLHGERYLARDSYLVVNGEVNRRISLSDPGIDDYRNELLWCPERPTLLQARVRLRRDGQMLDEFESYTALRSVDILRDRFMLNGRPYMLRLVLDQGYWPSSHLAAPDDEALRRDVELAKAMGFNGVRKHQKIEDPRYLYWADVLGLLVWEEMPSAYRFTGSAIKRVVKEWTEALARDYSHPCVIVWVPFNESWGVPELTSRRAQRDAVQALYHLTRTLDSTRPVIGNDGWESSATDIIGIHDYDTDPEHLRQRYASEGAPEQLFDRRRPGGRILTLDGYPHRGQPIMLTEFGGVACKVAQDDVTKPDIWGYTMVDDLTAFAEKFEALMHAVIHTPMFSGFCYTQFSDTFQEANGLLTADRQPKLPLEEIYRITTETRMHIRGGV
jgi:beta-galactosidase/beta-glucuronidase